jgi:hypothetical protein
MTPRQEPSRPNFGANFAVFLPYVGCEFLGVRLRVLILLASTRDSNPCYRCERAGGAMLPHSPRCR